MGQLHEMGTGCSGTVSEPAAKGVCQLCMSAGCALVGVFVCTYLCLSVRAFPGSPSRFITSSAGLSSLTTSGVSANQPLTRHRIELTNQSQNDELEVLLNAMGPSEAIRGLLTVPHCMRPQAHEISGHHPVPALPRQLPVSSTRWALAPHTPAPCGALFLPSTCGVGPPSQG